MDSQKYIDELLAKFIREINYELSPNNKPTNKYELTRRIIAEDMEKFSNLLRQSGICLKVNNTWRFADTAGSAKKAGLQEADQKYFSGAGIFNTLPILIALGKTGEYISKSEALKGRRIFFCGYTYSKEDYDARCFQIALLERTKRFWAFISNNQGALTTICVLAGKLPTSTRRLTINEILATRREIKEINAVQDFKSWKNQKKS